MTGLLIRGGTFGPGPGVKPLILDPILTVGSGSLLLLDVKNWATGVPTHGARLPNIARIQAENLGVGTSDETAGVFVQVGDLPGGGYGLVERTARGGLHVAVRQSADVPELHGYNVELPDAIMAYMVANYSHNFYISQWRALTRPALGTSPDGAKTFLGIEAGAAGGFAMMSHSSGQERPTSSTRVGRTVQGAGINTVGPTRMSLAGPYTAGSSAAPTEAQYASGLARAIAQFGTVQRQNNYSPLAAALQSWVFWRAYVEDLTVSGRSHAEVDAIDAALWSAAVGTGGRLAGDTYTAPSTVD
ncbi:MAG: hypothetical protein ACU0A5_10775 [Salipiger marinus]|uniref:hypothetical protein n=1 Tax=Salipiger marinus TaxID=555512 RepID=UPI0040592CAD